MAAPPPWHRELEQVLGLDEAGDDLLSPSWASVMQRRYGGPLLLQVYVLKQKAVSPHAKYADLRYNRHSPDFDETPQGVQDERWWKYLYPVWLDVSKPGLRLFHFAPRNPALTSVDLFVLAGQMEDYLTQLALIHRGCYEHSDELNAKWSWVHQSVDHHRLTYPVFEKVYHHHPRFINVDRRCRRRAWKSDPHCGVCAPLGSGRRQMSLSGVQTLDALKDLFMRVCELARATAFRALRRVAGLDEDEAYARWNHLVGDARGGIVNQDWADDFVNTRQRQLFEDVCHHVEAVAARFSARLVGRPTQAEHHFYHDPNVYEHLHGMLCCRVSKFARVKFHSLPKSMRGRCDMMGENHRLLPLSANMKTIERCMTLMRREVTRADDRRLARVKVYIDKRLRRAERRVTDPRCWFNYPLNMVKFRACGHVRASNEIERFTVYGDGASQLYDIDEDEDETGWAG